MGHCFATHPLELPRNFSKIFDIAIACGLVTVSGRVVQSWRPQDIKLSYKAVWVVYSNTFVLCRIIWNTLALISLPSSQLHYFNLTGCKMAVGNIPPPLLSCYSAHLLFPRPEIQGGHMQLYISVQLLPVVLWHHTHLQHHVLNCFLDSYRITVSQNGGGWKGPLWVTQSNPVTQSRLHKTLSRWVLNVSREGEPTTSLGILLQCSVTLRVKKFFFMFSWNFLCFSLCPLPLVLGTTEKSMR